MAPLSRLMSLPQEIVHEVLRNMDVRTLLRCSMLCLDMWRTIYGSVELTYTIELAQDGLIDNVPLEAEMSQADRLVALRKRRRAWAAMDWQKTSVVKVSGFCQAYELVGGVFAKGHGSRDFLAAWLPSMVQAEGRQILRKDLQIRSRDFAIDPGQDLIIFLEEGLIEQTLRNVRLHVRSLTTHECHPRARSSALNFTIRPHDEYGTFVRSIMIQVAGDIVAVWISTIHQRLLIWNWKEGILISDSSEEGYSLPNDACDFSFISPRAYILTSHERSGSIHIYSFRSEAGVPPFPAAILHLPDLCENVGVRVLNTHTGPFETPTPTQYFPLSTDARIHLLSIQYVAGHHIEQLRYTFFVHNRTFLSYLRARDADFGPLKTISVPWESWGPCETRWIAGLPPHSWLRYVHGARVVGPQSTNPSIKKIDIFDFNTVHTRFPPSDKARHPNTSGPAFYIEPSTIPQDEIFKKAVTTSLPFTLTTRKVGEQYSAYMIDAEHIIGLKARGHVDEELRELHVFTL